MISTKKSLLNRFADSVGINKKFSRRRRDMINKNPRFIISPVDATLFCLGEIDKKGNIISKHGKNVSLKNLIGKYAKKFHGGIYLNLYLSPKDKHYFVFPYEGTVRYIQKNEGKSFIPVMIGLDNIFGNQAWFSRAAEKNASIGIIVDSKGDKRFSYAMIPIGSLNVNNITVECIQGNKYKKGDYAGHFAVGSTLILCLDKNAINLFKVLIDKNQHEDIGRPILENISENI